MALDSKQKRGSAVGVGLSFRPWLAEPDGTLAAADRISLLKFCSAIAPASVTVVATRIIRIARADRVFIVPEDDE